VKPGDRVRQFDEICEVQSDKASVAITSRYDGIIKTLHFKVDDVALVGAALLDMEIESDTEEEEEDAGNASKAEPKDQVISDSNQEKKTTHNVLPETDNTMEQLIGKVLTTPAVRRLAMENNIKLIDVKATGKKGRVLKEDMLAHLEKISASSQVNKEEFPTQASVTGKMLELKGYSRHMWKTMTKSLVSRQKIACKNLIKPDARAFL